MGRLIGYARVSTSEQDLGLQLDALRGAGCRDEQIFLDTESGARTSRPGLEACLAAISPWRHARRVALGSPGPVDGAFSHRDCRVAPMPGRVSFSLRRRD
jgi:resolvase-like protein